MPKSNCGGVGQPPCPPIDTTGLVPIESNGRYALTAPNPTGYAWWTITDLEKMYAIVSVAEDFPEAEKIIRFAWSKLK